MKLTKIPAILGILTTALAVGGWVHLHAETLWVDTAAVVILKLRY